MASRFCTTGNTTRKALDEQISDTHTTTKDKQGRISRQANCTKSDTSLHEHKHAWCGKPSRADCIGDLAGYREDVHMTGKGVRSTCRHTHALDE
jgi:hypothetical protein